MFPPGRITPDAADDDDDASIPENNFGDDGLPCRDATGTLKPL